MSFRKACLERGCPRTSEPGSSRCAVHETAVERDRSRARNARRGATPAADRLYRQLVKQGSAYCEGCDAAYLQPALRVDHRTAIADGGADDMANLQILCKWCHDEKTLRENQRRRT